jgi:hypothetical protein
MYDQNQPNHPPDELTQNFWQAWRDQEGSTPRLAHLLLQRGRQLLGRFQYFHDTLSKLSRPAQQRWQRKLGASLAGVALTPSGITVDGVCTLVDAITGANTGTAVGSCASGGLGADTITLLTDVTLTTVNNTTSSDNGLPVINSAITIEGNGHTITRAGSAPHFRIFHMVAGGNLTLNNTTVSGGYSFGLGGGILNEYGTLTLNNSTVSGNSAGGGGGINVIRGTASLNNSTVSSNSDTAGGGGGIDIYYGAVSLSNTTISNNSGGRGGGISNFNGALTLESSLISGNSGFNGQEIYSYGGGCLNAATVSSPNCLAGVDMPLPASEPNLFGHSGLSNAQAFVGFTPSGSDITATSDGNTPTTLATILDTTLQVNAPGNTATHALVAGSPAVDAATSGPATDQRGVSRPQGSGFDIGAYELEQASNQPPTVAADNATVTVDEGQTATNTGTVSDPDNEPVSLSASVGTVVNNGDGAWSWSFNTTDGPPQSQTVTITADDGNGGVSQTSFSLTVNNVAPTVGAISAPVNPQPVGATVNASGSFSDPGTGDTHTAAWDWSDGNTSAGTVGSGTVGPNSHTYTTPGVYTVKLTVTDDDGGVGESIYQYVLVYDPAGGFVTSGGWITSPAGAYVPDPALTGKANFGFNSKYKQGQSTPSGNTEFQFKVADLNFKSSSYEWLVVAGSHAKFKGVGTINGGGNYGFMLTATDGQISGGGGVDKFRIKIWDKNNGDAVVYDNQMSEGDDSNAGTALGGGSIVIHKGGNGNNAAAVADTAQNNVIFLPLVTR